MGQAKRVRLDSKGRITLGKYVADGIVGFEVQVMEDRSILLIPTVEIPAKEAWLFQNSKALTSVKTGLQQAAVGDVTPEIVDYTKYLDDSED